LPYLFSAFLWWIILHPIPILPQLPLAVRWKHRTSCSYNANLIPDTLHDAFELGKLSVKMNNFHSEDTSTLLQEANDILNNNKENYNLTVEDVTGGNIGAAIEQYCNRRAKYKIFRGMFSFVGILSIISIIGIFATLYPTLKFLYKELHLDYLWFKIISIAAWILRVIEPLIDIVLFSIPLAVADQALYFSDAEGARSQMNILAAGFAIMAFIYRAWRNEGTQFDISSQKYFSTISFLWGCTFLIPLALIGNSQFLGFFAVGCIFSALGFIALPMPFGWVAGFQDEVSMEKCMYTSMVIISFSIVSRTTSFLPGSIVQIFQLGMTVFGMLSFGLAGLIKSSKASDDGFLVFGGAVNPMTFIYPISWLFLGCIGSLISYASLTNTSITFVCLWMSQFYWRIAGITAVSTFVLSCILFYVTLVLKTHKDFLASLLEI